MARKSSNIISDEKLFNILVSLPAWILLSLIFVQWILPYDSILSYLIYFCLVIFFGICVITAIYQLMREKIKNCIFIMLPVVLFCSIMFTPLGDILRHARHYVEFLIQKNIYVPEIADISNGKTNGITYKEWCVAGTSKANYRIVYDATDEVIEKKGANTIVFDDNYMHTYYVSHIEGHFYMMEILYGEMIRF